MKQIAVAGTFVAAATSSEVVLWSRAGQQRARIPGLAGKHSAWRVGPDGAYVATLDEQGVALFHADGSPVPIHNEDYDDEIARLYPNDGIAGVLPLDAERLLIWAIGHNVYEPLTICDVAAGKEIAHRKIPGFATDAATWAGCGGFVILTTTGSLELRSSSDGKRVKSLGRVKPAENEWGWLQVVSSGETLLVVDGRTVTVVKRQKTGKYAVVTTLVDVPGTVQAHPDAEQFAIIVRDRCDVYSAAGKLQGTIELQAPTAERHAALSADGRLAVGEGKRIDVYDLRALTLSARGTLEADLTAIAPDATGFWLGTAAGSVLHATS